MDTILEVKNLCIDFVAESQLFQAVDDISFNLHKGETIGIVGESGSGKSVTALSIMGLLDKRIIKIKGDIFYSDKANLINLNSIQEEEFRKIRGKNLSMIFQEPMTSLNPSLTCGYQVKEMLCTHLKISSKEAKKEVIKLFNEVQLPNPNRIYKAYPYEISGGQKQRVMIAMAIACKPDILIADEPTTALDVTIQQGIIELLKKIQRELNISIIFISHDLGVIYHIASYVLVVYKGKVVEQGKVDDIFFNPQHPYTKGLMACRPPQDYRVKKLLTVDDFINGNKNFSTPLIDSYKIEQSQRIESHEKMYSRPPILEIDNLTKKFILQRNIFGKAVKTINAVNNVSINVFKGETLGLVGESGCGKTSLGRAILQLNAPMQGNIFFYRKNILSMNRKQLQQLRGKIQIIFQDPYSSLNPGIRVGSAIVEVMKVHHICTNYKERKEKTIDLFEKVGLDSSHFSKYPHEFSGGQRQRICIARALAVNPEIIICDESVSALDISIQAQVLNLLNELKTSFGFTYIFISHDLSVVKFMSDRLIVMKNGEIIEEGDADKIYQNPKHEYTKKLIQSIPTIRTIN